MYAWAPRKHRDFMRKRFEMQSQSSWSGRVCFCFVYWQCVTNVASHRPRPSRGENKPTLPLQGYIGKLCRSVRFWRKIFPAQCQTLAVSCIASSFLTYSRERGLHKAVIIKSTQIYTQNVQSSPYIKFVLITVYHHNTTKMFTNHHGMMALCCCNLNNKYC